MFVMSLNILSTRHDFGRVLRGDDVKDRAPDSQICIESAIGLRNFDLKANIPRQQSFSKQIHLSLLCKCARSRLRLSKYHAKEERSRQQRG